MNKFFAFVRKEFYHIIRDWRSLIILIGIMTKSSVFSMVISYVIFFILSPILASRETIFTFIDNKGMKYILEFLYYIIPQTSELSSITSKIASGNSPASFEPLIISSLLLILILSVSIIIFSKKDY